MKLFAYRRTLPGPFTPTRDELTEIVIALYEAAEAATNDNRPATAQSYLALRTLIREVQREDPIEQDFVAMLAQPKEDKA